MLSHYCTLMLRAIANHRGTATETRSSDRTDAARARDRPVKERIDDSLCDEWAAD